MILIQPKLRAGYETCKQEATNRINFSSNENRRQAFRWHYWNGKLSNHDDNGTWWKHHLKSEFALFQNSSLLFPLTQFHLSNVTNFFLELNAIRLNISPQKEKEKENHCQLNMKLGHFTSLLCNNGREVWHTCKVVYLPIQTYSLFATLATIAIVFA